LSMFLKWRLEWFLGHKVLYISHRYGTRGKTMDAYAANTESGAAMSARKENVSVRALYRAYRAMGFNSRQADERAKAERRAIREGF